MSIETNLVCKSVNDKFSCLLLAQDSFACCELTRLVFQLCINTQWLFAMVFHQLRLTNDLKTRANYSSRSGKKNNWNSFAIDFPRFASDTYKYFEV